MSNHLRLRTGLTAGVAAAGLTLSAGMIAQLTSANATAVTVGTNYQEGSSRTTHTPPTTGFCSNGNFCYVVFNVVPSGKQLLITYASCSFFVSGQAFDDVWGVYVITAGPNNAPTDRKHVLAPQRTYTDGSTASAFIASGAVQQIVKAGERPLIHIRSQQHSTFSPVECSITGIVGNPPVP